MVTLPARLGPAFGVAFGFGLGRRRLRRLRPLWVTIQPAKMKASELGQLWVWGAARGIKRNAFHLRLPLAADLAGFVVARIVARTQKEPVLEANFVVHAESSLLRQTDCCSLFSPTRGTDAVSLTALDLGGNEVSAPGKPLP